VAGPVALELGVADGDAESDGEAFAVELFEAATGVDAAAIFVPITNRRASTSRAIIPPASQNNSFWFFENGALGPRGGAATGVARPTTTEGSADVGGAALAGVPANAPAKVAANPPAKGLSSVGSGPTIGSPS